MEKNQNTPNGDDLCIKYVMNELDPSEIHIIRKEMDEDEDLLIEIECLSRTWGKIRQLPEIEPPAEVSEAIVQQASRHHEMTQKHYWRGSLNNTTMMASAAAVIFGLSIGVANFYPQLIGFTAGGEGGENVATMEEQIEPWVDNNNVLHLNASEAGFSISAMDSTSQSGLEQLQIFDNQNLLRHSQQGTIQLTRTQSQ